MKEIAMRPGGRLLQKIGRFAIPHITRYWIAFQVLCMVLIWARPDVAGSFMLDTNRVLSGEWWRVITFLFMPGDLSPIFAAFALYFLWLMGTALEMNWGTARYNFYLFFGAAMNILAAFIPMLAGAPGIGSNYYLLESVFLAFAALYPDFSVYVFFILPVRVKWLALLTWGLLGFQFVTGGWTEKAMVVASVTNYLLFFWRDILASARFGRGQMGRQMRRITQLKPAAAAPAIMHQCMVCKATDKSAPQLEFRYCSACGGACYCLEHLRSHVCVATAAGQIGGPR